MSLLRYMATGAVMMRATKQLPTVVSSSNIWASAFVATPTPQRYQLRKRAFAQCTNQHKYHHCLTKLYYTTTTTTTRLRNSDDSAATSSETRHPEPMENLYREWSLDQDQLLWESRNESLPKLAALLGRGLKGVEARLEKLKDVNSSAYERLFASNKKTSGQKDRKETEDDSKTKLVPVSEVLRRIQWDYSLSTSDFFLLHYDRVEDSVVESPMDAPNESIKGSSTSLVDALPEHRILAIKYKEQIVWDREKKLDKVFSDGGIEHVIETYDEWKRNKDANEDFLRQRQAQVDTHIRQILGLNRYDIFKTVSSQLQSTLEDPSVSAKLEAERFVKASLALFQQARDDPSESLEPSFIPRSDIEAIECLSEMVALSPHARLRKHVLNELAIVLSRFEGKSPPGAAAEVDPFNRELPELSEDDLTETFVRGSGPGGQKINKTNNKVLLIHNQTQLRVECQETRSLQQNRKIARKRMRLKLDEFLNGSQSRTSVKAEKAATKKQKAKARARARNRKKAAAKESKEKS